MPSYTHSTGMRVLAALHPHDPRTTGELAKALRASTHTLRRTLHEMLAAGLVAKCQAPNGPGGGSMWTRTSAGDTALREDGT